MQYEIVLCALYVSPIDDSITRGFGGCRLKPACEQWHCCSHAEREIKVRGLDIPNAIKAEKIQEAGYNPAYFFQASLLFIPYFCVVL